MLDYKSVQNFFYDYTHAVNKITKTPTKEAWNDIAVRSRVWNVFQRSPFSHVH